MFQCISWHWELTQTTTDVLYEFAQRYLWLAQYLAWISGVEVLIGGNIHQWVHQFVDIYSRHYQGRYESIPIWGLQS
jgi:hypothetical protein